MGVSAVLSFSVRTLKCVILGAAFMVGAARAADYPSRPVVLIVPSSPGTSADTMARFLAEGMRGRLGQPVLVETRTGGGGVIAVKQTIAAPADGHTLLLYVDAVNTGSFFEKSYDVDPITRLTHIIELALTAGYLVTNAQTPFRTMPEMIAYAKANPGKMNIGSAYPQNEWDLKQMIERLGVDIQVIPYQGTAAILQSVISNDLQLGVPAFNIARGLAADGKLRFLAIMHPDRSTQMPNLPSITEFAPGFGGVYASTGISGPPGLPGDIVTRLNRVLNEILKEPAVRDRIINVIGSEVRGGTPEMWRASQEQVFNRYKRETQAKGLVPR